MNTLFIAAIVATTYAWVRFCDRVVRPRIERRQSEAGYGKTLEAVYLINHLEGARDDLANSIHVTDAEIERAQAAIDKRIADVVGRLSRAGATK